MAQCGACGKPLAASWSKGRKARYPYYRCSKKGCGGVNVRKEVIEAQFLALIEEMRPKPKYVALFRDVVLDVWKQRSSGVSAKRKQLQQRIEDLRAKKDTLVDAYLFKKKIDDATYQRMVEQLDSEILPAGVELQNAATESLDLDVALNFACYVLLHPGRLWIELPVDQKQQLQAVLFPEGLRYLNWKLWNRENSTHSRFVFLETAPPPKADCMKRSEW